MPSNFLYNAEEKREEHLLYWTLPCDWLFPLVDTKTVVQKWPVLMWKNLNIQQIYNIVYVKGFWQPLSQPLF